MIMAATSVPQLIAYAETAGYAGYRGLTTAGPPLAAWGVATGHPYMNAGVTSITAIMTRNDLHADSFVAHYGEQKYVELVSAYSACISIASVVLAVSGFGRLAQNVPKPVLMGFKWGCALGVLIAALPNGLFLQGSSELKVRASNSALLQNYIAPYKSLFPGWNNVSNVLYGLLQPWAWGIVPTLMFVVGTAFVMNSKHVLPEFLPPGTDVILVTAAAALYSKFTKYTGDIVGDIPAIDPDAGISLFGVFRIPVELMNFKNTLSAPLVQQFGGSFVLLSLSGLLFAAVNYGHCDRL